MNSALAAIYPPASLDEGLRALNEAGRRTYMALFASEHFLGPQLSSRLLGGVRERNRARMLEYFAGSPRNVLQPAPERTFTSHEQFYRQHAWAAEPAVFRGIAKDWPAVRNWDLNFFADNYAATPAVMIDQEGLTGDDEDGRFEVTTLGRIASAIIAGEKRCLRFAPIIDENPHLKDDLDMAWLRGFRSKFSMREFFHFFLAPAATHTPMHCALESNAFVQVYGRKRWRFYPAMYQPFLDPPADRRPYFHSNYRPDKPSAEFPLGPYAPALEVVLEPGDAMYVPPFVWHCVDNLTPTVAVAYRFFSLSAGMQSSWLLTILKFLATKPSLLRTLYYSITKKPNFIYRPRVQ